MKRQTTTENFLPFLALFEEVLLASKVNEGETLATAVAQETTDDN